MHDYKVILTWEAIYDVTDIADYIEAEFGQARADRFQNDIQAQMKKLGYMSGVFPKTHILYRNYYIHKKPFPPSIIFMYLWNILRKYIFSEFCGRNVTGQGYLNRSPIIHILNDFGNRQ